MKILIQIQKNSNVNVMSPESVSFLNLCATNSGCILFVGYHSDTGFFTHLTHIFK